MSVGAIILAAGSSTRLGQPKQDVLLGQETLLERTVRTALLAALEPVFVVIAPGTHSGAPGKRSALDPAANLLVSENAAEGMAASIRTGIAAAMSADLSGVIILACDQPAVTADHLRALASSEDEIVASSYVGRRGVPAYFPRSAFTALMELSGDTGARDMLRCNRAIDLKQGELDIDTAEDLERARELYADDPPFWRTGS